MCAYLDAWVVAPRCLSHVDHHVEHVPLDSSVSPRRHRPTSPNPSPQAPAQRWEARLQHIPRVPRVVHVGGQNVLVKGKEWARISG